MLCQVLNVPSIKEAKEIAGRERLMSLSYPVKVEVEIITLDSGLYICNALKGEISLLTTIGIYQKGWFVF